MLQLLLLLTRFSHAQSVWRWQPIRLLHPWDSPGKNSGVGCYFLLQCMKVKRESEVAQSCLTLCNPIDGSPPGSSIPGILQARILEWVAMCWAKCILFYCMSPRCTQWVQSSLLQASLEFCIWFQGLSLISPVTVSIVSRQRVREEERRSWNCFTQCLAQSKMLTMLHPNPHPNSCQALPKGRWRKGSKGRDEYTLIDF